MGNEVDSQDSSREPEAGETPNTLVHLLEQDERTQSEPTQESLTLATSVGIHQSLVGRTPDGPQEQPPNLNNLHDDTFYHLGSLILSSNHHGPHITSSPWAFHDARFGPQVDLCRLEDAMECMSRALSLTANGHLDSSNRLNSLVASNEQPGPYALTELGGREMVMGYMSQALLLMPDAHPGLPKWLSVMGTSHADQFRRLRGLSDLEKAIEYTYRALTFAPDSDPDQINRLDNLGEFHGHRFRRLGELCDLEKAMGYMHGAVTLTPDGHPDLPRRLNNMGIFHGDRFHRLGELVDTEKAVEYGSRALELTPDDHPDQPKWLSSLGASYRDRFQRLGELSDLEIALDLVSRAHILIPEGHSDMPHILSNLSASYRDRFQVLNKLGDLEHAIEYSFRALALTPDGHPDLPNLLSSLGASHRDRFQRLGELNDLEKAIDFIARAIALTPDGHPDLPKWLNSLGESQGDQYQCLGDLSDLSRAVNHAYRALLLTPVGHASLPAQSSLLARLRIFQSRAMHSDLYLLDTLKYFRMASQSLAGAPRVKFKIALQWAKHASEHGSLNCIEAYQTAIDLLPQFIWLGATTNQRYEDLRTAEALAVDAAAAAILSSQYALALEWVEHARCVVWYQSLMLRSPLDELQSSHPGLAMRLQNVSKKLNDASSESREYRAVSESLTLEQVGQEHRRLAMEYDDLLSQARKLPGFEKFLQPKKANELVHAARIGPIVVVNCSDRCDALLIFPGKDNINHIPLPNFTKEKAQVVSSSMKIALRRKGMRARGVRVRLERQGNDAIESVLKTLWYDLVKPIIKFLGYTRNVPTDNLPHITWCPTGLMTFLPFHAAGDYTDPSSSRVFDYVVSSYTPILTALLASTPSSLSHDCRVLAIGQPHTPNMTRLPGTVMELAYVQAHTKDKAMYSQLVDNQATTSAVIDAMERHDWVHMACHAHQNVRDPTKSGFFLYDGVLDLAAINRQSFKNKGVAFLSACQTATGDEILPDEAIHLASAMLMAGYPSVIATMWSIADQEAPIVADKVYGQLMKGGGVGNGEAGEALHHAITKLREKVGEKNFMCWVPYIHIGS